MLLFCVSCHIVLEDKIPFYLLIPIDLVLGVPAVGLGARDMSLPACTAGVCPGLGPAMLVAWGGTAALLFSSSAGI